MSRPSVRGVQSNQEIKPSRDIRDLRSNGERLQDWIERGEGLWVLGFACLGGMFVFPTLMEIVGIMLLMFLLWARKRPFSLPFRLPMHAGIADPNDPLPGGIAAGPPAGIAFLGNDRITQQELWFNNSDMRTHLLVFGSTGAGKALPDNANVRTPDGWKKMGALAHGDMVVRPDGSSAKIHGVFPQGEMTLWKLILEDGREIACSADHLWTVLPHAPSAMIGEPAAEDEEQPWGDWEDADVLTTADLQYQLLMWGHESPKGLAIPLPRGIEAPTWVSGYQANDLVGVAIESLKTPGAEFPWAAAQGSLRQRQQFWDGLTQGYGNHWMDRSEFAVAGDRAAQALVEFAWAMGWWASKTASVQGEGTFAVVVKRAERGVRVRAVERTEAVAPCTCIEIEKNPNIPEHANGLFITDDYVVTHNTETLISMAFNSLIHGSGFIYVDGKGDSTLFTKFFSMTRSVGREDDLLVVNFMLAKDLFGPQSVKLSNTMNPFANGSAGGLTELLVSLMDEAGGDGAMWKGRAISLISSIMFALVYLREYDGQLLGVGEIRNYLMLENIQALSRRRDLPAVANSSINAYLHSLPGYQPNAAKQSETALDQHGYLQMQFTRILGSLADTYGHIFNTNLGEVDFEDVVVNRRVLAVLLPALGKSLDELSNLGKIIVTSIKQMMSAGLGDVLEGDYEDIIESKPTANEPAPFMCIFDEYGYYVVKGASVILAQGRSLGFSIVVAGQDFPSFKKNNNAEEAAATIGNCNIKIFMKIEDPTDTFDLFEKTVGEAMVGRTTGMAMQTGGLSNVYMDQNNASIERRKRGDWLDLKDQREGEAHIIFKSTMIRANMFYANPKKPSKLRLNHFLRVKPPTAAEMRDIDAGMENLRKTLLDTQLVQDHIQGTPQLPASVRAAFAVAGLEEEKWTVQQGRGMAAAKRLDRSHLSTFEERTRQMADFEEEDFGGSIFSQGLADYDADDDEENSVSLDPDDLLSSLTSVGQAAGATEQDAKEAAAASVDDLRVISAYPHVPPPPMDASEILDIIQRIDDGVDEFDDRDGADGGDEDEQEEDDDD